MGQGHLVCLEYMAGPPSLCPHLPLFLSPLLPHPCSAHFPGWSEMGGQGTEGGARAPGLITILWFSLTLLSV